jgi:hypothetical protein
VFRRDPSITRPLAEAIDRSRDGIPYLAPELVLLFKAKHSERARDRFDLERALPRLDRQQRRWLSAALERAHPGYEWTALVARQHARRLI